MRVCSRPHHRALPWLAFMFLLLLAAGPAAAQSYRVTVESLTPAADSAPRGLVTLVYRVWNESDAPASLMPQPELPSGWRMVVPPEPVDLEAGEEARGLLSVLVPATAAAGEYSILLGMREVSGLLVEPARFSVRVGSLRAVQAVLLEAPTHAVAGSPYEARFSVQNAGNVPQELTFRVRQNLDVPVTLAPESEILPPGATVTVVARVQVPEDRSRPLLHTLTLIASSTEDPGAQASASANVELIPQTPPAKERYRTFPLRVAVERELSSEEGASLGWSARGSGRVSEQAPGILTVRLAEEASTLWYSQPGLNLAVGAQRFDLSPLTDAGAVDSGASLRLSQGTWDLALYHRTESGGTTGIQAAHRRVSTGGTLAVQALLQREGADRLSLAARTSIGNAWQAGAELGVQGAAQGWSDALRAETAWALPPFGGVLSWERSDAGYLERSGRLEGVSLTNSLRIGSDGHLTLRWEEEREEEAGENRTTERLTTSLTGGLGGGSWGVRYLQMQRGDGSAFEREERSVRTHALHLLPVPEGSSLLHVVEWSDVVERSSVELSTESTSYQASLRLPLEGGSFSPYVRLASEEQDGAAETRWRLGVRVDQDLDESRSVSLLGEVNAGALPGYRVWGSAVQRLSGEAELILQADGRWPADDERRLTARLGFALPLDLPIGLRSDVGEVSGRVVDEDGVGLPGLIVRVQGLAATTGLDGRFRFPAVSSGVAIIELSPEQIGPERISLPRTPLQVEVAAGGRVEQSFRVVRGATVQGQVRLQEVEDAGSVAGTVWGEGEEPLPEMLRGVVVELANHETSMRRVLDSTGRFVFERVSPGEWTLSVLKETLPGPYRAEPAQLALSLEPGASESVEIAVAREARRIQFLQQGTVEALEAP